MFRPFRSPIHAERHPSPDQIGGRNKIITVLRELQARRELLRINPVGSQDAACSAILGVRESQNCFLLDEPNNASVHQALLQSRKVAVECRLRGMQLRFCCRLLTVDTSASPAVYLVSLPEYIRRTQRRGDFRLLLAPSTFVPVTVPDLDGRTVHGEAFDLSACGLGAFLNTRSMPERGALLRGISLSLPHASVLVANLEIRFARLETTRRLLRVGGQFVNLPREQQRQLSRFLAEQQRKRRRHDAS